MNPETLQSWMGLKSCHSVAMVFPVISAADSAKTLVMCLPLGLFGVTHEPRMDASCLDVNNRVLLIGL